MVYKFLLPLAIPMLLFSADLRCGRSRSGSLLRALPLGRPTGTGDGNLEHSNGRSHVSASRVNAAPSLKG